MVDCVGLGSGLAPFWTHEVDVSLISYSMGHIGACVQDIRVWVDWFLLDFIVIL